MFDWSLYDRVPDLARRHIVIIATFDWLKRQPWIEFAHLDMLHDWDEAEIDSFGLMEIVLDADGRLPVAACHPPRVPSDRVRPS